MTLDDTTDALSPLFEFFGVAAADVDWAQYAESLDDVHPSDLDDAIADLRKTWAYRNAPLPAEIRVRCTVARKHRQLSTPEPAAPTVGQRDGTPHTLTIPGIGSLTVRVLDDDHPAMARYACPVCHDSGWREYDAAPRYPPTGMPVSGKHGVRRVPMTGVQHHYAERCGCVANNPAMQMARERQRAKRDTARGQR